MTDIAYWDCNVCLGRPQTGTFRPCRNPDELLPELDWVGVDKALVRHELMSAQSPVVGNRILSELIAGHPRLLGSWAILPPQTGEFDPAGSFDAMAEAQVRALWAFPEHHRYMLNRLTFGSFLDEVSERGIPLLIPRQAGGPRPTDTYYLLTHLLGEYPQLTVILTAQGPWGEDRLFRPLLERYSGFHLDLSRYELDGGLAELVARYGAERLLYGSNYPQNAMGGPRLMVARAEMSDEARRAIAGGNLRRLLEGVQL
jgi:predicted TIM-barrel fold metal-dependent hydrolase